MEPKDKKYFYTMWNFLVVFVLGVLLAETRNEMLMIIATAAFVELFIWFWVVGKEVLRNEASS